MSRGLHRRPLRLRFARIVAACLLWPAVCVAARADEVTIAVAANFLVPLRALVAEFEAQSGHEAIVVSGSTGLLYAQIVNGAPYQILLAADSERPALLAADGFGPPTSVFTYAYGQLALWSAEEHRVDASSLEALGGASFRWFAIAEPEVAPYGRAAYQVLTNLGLWQQIEPRLVRGQNIAQTFAMLATGNADLGLVALSQALSYRASASFAVVPADLHEPIRQDAILLGDSERAPAAVAFAEYLKGPAAAAIIAQSGYSVPTGAD